MRTIYMTIAEDCHLATVYSLCCKLVARTLVIEKWKCSDVFMSAVFGSITPVAYVLILLLIS